MEEDSSSLQKQHEYDVQEVGNAQNNTNNDDNGNNDPPTTDVLETLKEPFVCPNDGCNVDLTNQTEYNRGVHVQWCQIRIDKKKEEEKKMIRKHKSKSAALLDRFLIKKPKVTDEVDDSELNEIDFMTNNEQENIDAIPNEPSIFRDEQSSILTPDQDPTVLVSIDGNNSDPDECDVLDDNDVDPVDTGMPDTVVKYCAGVTPAGMENNIFHLLPFQLIPDLKVVVFSDHSLHHVECKLQNFILSQGASDVNNVCSQLLTLDSLHKVIERATLNFQDLSNYNNKFLNFTQIANKSNYYHAQLNRSKLDVINLRSRVNKLGETVSMYQRFVHHIANNKISRLRELVRVALRNNRGITYIVSKVVDAVKGVYLARPSEDDKDLALLILEFGGPSLLDICHKANALPSVSTAYRIRKKSKKIQSTIGTSVTQCLRENTSLDETKSSHAFSIKADETHVTSRLRYDGKEDVVQGLCAKHGVDYNKFNTFEEAEMLCEAVKNKTVCVPKEVTVVVGCSLDGIEPTQVISAMPTCEKDDFVGAKKMFKELALEYKKLTGKDPMNYCTDGDPTRRQVFDSLLGHDLDPMSPLGQMLCGIKLLDLLVGIHNETVSYDPKHLAKRCWTSFLNESIVFNGITVTKSDLRKLFLLLPDANSLKIDGLLTPDDKQNVPSATDFLLMFIDATENVPHSQFPYRLMPIHKELVMLAKVIDGVLSFYVYTDVDISSQIIKFSVASHSLFYLTRANSVKVMPNQLYHDLQCTFIDALFCCAKGKVYSPEKPMYLVRNGTDPVERVFGVARMKMKNSAMDYFTLLQCLGSMLRCDFILNAKHPDWSKKSRASRRLCLDYSNPAVWNKEALILTDVDVAALWESGHLNARSDALQKGIVKSTDPSIDELVRRGCSLKKPKGKLIGVNEVETDQSQIENEPTDDSDNQPTDYDETDAECDDLEVPLPDLLHNDERTSVIDIDGKSIYKASVIKMLFSSNKLSKDRLKRVQGLTGGSSHQPSCDEDVSIVLIGDPLVVFHNNETKIANINKMKLGNVSKKSITLDDLEKPNLEFEIQFLKLREIGDNQRLFWDGTYIGSTMKVSGRHCSLIKPGICAQPPEGMSNYYYDKQFLLDLGVQNTLNQQQQQQQQPSSSSKCDSKTKTKNKCKLCRKEIPQDRMRGHIGYHILEKKDVAAQVCGFCGLASCASKSSLKGSSKSGKGIFYKLESTCNYFFSYGRKPQFSKRSRCSNHLVKCRAVGCSADIWTYHMLQHYRECHPLLVVPDDFKVSEEEKKAIVNFKNQ